MENNNTHKQCDYVVGTSSGINENVVNGSEGALIDLASAATVEQNIVNGTISPEVDLARSVSELTIVVNKALQEIV
ncbi:hypothetical protein A2U01_0053782, partial [Trifolium medium]|nr:hypothetical protein [Trifolium medium]